MMAEDILWEIEFNRYIENQKREGIDEGKAIGEKSGLEKGKILGEKSGIEKGKILGEKSGLEKGIALGEIKSLIKLVKKGYLPLDKAIEESGLTEEEFKKRLK